jgi:hypothetical protein
VNKEFKTMGEKFQVKINPKTGNGFVDSLNIFNIFKCFRKNNKKIDKNNLNKTNKNNPHYNYTKLVKNKFEHRLDIFSQELMTTLTTLIKDFSNNKFSVLKYFPIDFCFYMHDNYLKKLNHLYESSHGDFELKLKKTADDFCQFYNINKTLKSQKEELESLSQNSDQNDKNTLLSRCILCNNNERNVVFFPCCHLLYCNNCIDSKNILINTKNCTNCNSEIKEIKILSN